MGGCKADGQLDTAKYGGPLPWVGLYIAAGSLVCGVCMTTDVIRCLANGVFRFTTKLFPLNAATLTALSVAIKFAVDLNTAMPGRADQLSKLSSVVLLCVAMNHFMPSLGFMSHADIAANVAALGILVVTVVANICIQMGTGVIYTFLPEHAIVLLITLLILVLILSTALNVPPLKDFSKTACSSWNSWLIGNHGYLDPTPDGLDRFMEDYLIVARMQSVQCIISNSDWFVCSTSLCLIASGILVEATVRSIRGGSMAFCKGSSDYRWSTTLVLIIQSVTIFFGAAMLYYRCMIATSVSNAQRWSYVDYSHHWKNKLTLFKVSRRNITRGWMKKLILSYLVVFYGLNIFLFKLLRSTLQGITVFCRLFLLIPGACSNFYCKLHGSLDAPDAINFRLEVALRSTYVFPFSGGEDLAEAVSLKNTLQQAYTWIEKGRKRKPTQLIELITQKHSRSMSGFHGVLAFMGGDDHHPSPSYESEIRSWALPIVTLARIGMKIPGVENERLNILIEAIREGLIYVKFIDRLEGILGPEWNAVDRVWSQINLEILFKLESEKLSEQNRERERIHGWTNDLSEYYLQEGRDGVKNKSSGFLALCGDKVVSTIIADCNRTGETREGYPFLPRTDANLFDWIEATISDILRACLVNLAAAIRKSCFNSSIEDMEDNAKIGALLLGQAGEGIMTPLCQHRGLLPHDGMSIIAWRRNLRAIVQREEGEQCEGG